jgi:hypothetical protein
VPVPLTSCDEGVGGRKLIGLGRIDDEYRALRVVCNRVWDATENTFRTAHTFVADNDQVSTQLARRLNDCLGWWSGYGVELGVDVGPLCEPAKSG